MKKVYFTCGLPRSGNTLFASILNQNPNITATGHSTVPDIFYSLYNTVNSSKIHSYWKDDQSIDNLYRSIFKTYYSHYTTDYIIERGDWISPFNIELLKKYPPNEIKIVILVRDILDIIKSFLNLCNKYPSFFINSIYNNLDKTTLYLPKEEELCDIIMSKGEFIDFTLFSIKYILDNNLDHLCMFVEYKDLISQPDKVIRDVYDFYGIEHFNHNFSQLSQLSNGKVSYDDSIFGAPIHEINCNGIFGVDHDIVLPEKAIVKYSNLEIWRK